MTPATCVDETAAVEFLEQHRWGAEPFCPRCGVFDVVRMRSRTGERNKRFLWICHSCKKQFTVRIGTVMEDSRIPARFWCLVFYRMCNGGIGAVEIKRETGLSYGSALFLLHRISHALSTLEPLDPGPQEANTCRP